MRAGGTAERLGEMIVARLYKVTFHFKWQDRDDTSVYHCGSLAGAREFVKKTIAHGDARWYCIEGQDFMPCNDDDPGGQLFIGARHFEFKEVD